MIDKVIPLKKHISTNVIPLHQMINHDISSIQAD